MKMNTIKALRSDSKEILKLQKLAYQSEAKLYNDYNIPPLIQSHDEIDQQFDNCVFLKVIQNGSIIGCVRAFENNGTCYIGRLIVHPDFQKRGIGKKLMKDIENVFKDVKRFELFTGSKSTVNINFYKKLDYNIFKSDKLTEEIEFVYFEKKIP